MKVLWDVDTQADFMEPSGKLYVPDAKTVAPAMELLVDAARAARLVRKVRNALDNDGFEHVKIVASGGFTIDKISEFEAKGVPVDAYGVGSSLIRGSNDFTGDIVITDGKPSAKVGRHYRENPRLELVT